MNNLWESRIFCLCCLFLSAFLALGGRLAYLQLVQGKTLAQAAVAERTLRLPLGNFLRGDIRDRSGRSLLDGQTTYHAAVFPPLATSSLGVAVSAPSSQQQGAEEILAAIAESLPARADRREMQVFLQEAVARRAPFLIPVSLTRPEAQSLAKQELPGVYIISIPQRYGPGALAPHLTGFVQGSPLKGAKQQGIKGIEAVFDQALAPAGERLELLTVVDRRQELLEGRGLRLRGEEGAVTGGKNVILTLDTGIQQAVEEVLDKYGVQGAVAVLDIPTGEARALASRPRYNQLTGAGDQFDRSLALYHPGSIFKIVVAAAALSEGRVRPDERFFCTGKYSFNEHEAISCWKEGGHGSLTFREAFACSCNPVFVEVAQRLERRELEHYARLLGVETGMPGYPPPSWRGGEISIGDYPGQLGNVALGQEGVRMSPVNAAALAATIARGGVYIQPRVVKMIQDEDGKTVRSFPGRAAQDVLSPEASHTLAEMMAQVVSQGTGERAEAPGLGVAGKTGSAETGRQNAAGDPVIDAWFVGYAPRTNPRLAAAVFVEGGGAGGGITAEIFREIMERISHPGTPDG